MNTVVESVPASLYGDLSKKLVSLVLGTTDKDAIPSDLAKKIIYLWRQDQLASRTGIQTLLEAAHMADPEGTYTLLNELGLKELTVALKNLQ